METQSTSSIQQTSVGQYSTRVLCERAMREIKYAQNNTERLKLCLLQIEQYEAIWQRIHTSNCVDNEVKSWSMIDFKLPERPKFELVEPVTNDRK